MAYIGKQPVVGNFQVCDAISVVNGQAAYTMQVASANVEPENANHMLVSLNGVLQKPGSSFTISGATITFASNLATGDVIDFIIILGNVLDIGTPSDDSVGAAQIKNDLISGTTALASEPDDTDEFLVSDAGTLKRIDYSLIKGGGKVNQVLQTVKDDTFSTTSTSFTDITGLSVAITPSATSSKILVMYNIFLGNNADNRSQVKLLRSSTDIFVGASDSANRTESSGFGYAASDGSGSLHANSGVFLDSPSTTSETTYKLQAIVNAGTFYLNRTGNDSNNSYQPRTASSITVMEVLA